MVVGEAVGGDGCAVGYSGVALVLFPAVFGELRGELGHNTVALGFG